MSSRPLAALVGAVLLAAALALGGCSQQAPETTAPEVTATPLRGAPPATGTRIEVRITAHDVRASARRVRVAAGSPVALVIHASAPGELHVHSSPEQHVSYPRGTSVATVRLRQPGVVDVESHELDQLVTQLEVR